MEIVPTSKVPQETTRIRPGQGSPCPSRMYASTAPQGAGFPFSIWRLVYVTAYISEYRVTR